ncbi:MAG: hypothetical protein ACOZB0_04500 [Pseudomonadota bacterium]
MLKGAAGNLGLSTLHQAAKAWEETFARAPAEPGRSNLAAALADTLGLLRVYLSESVHRLEALDHGLDATLLRPDLEALRPFIAQQELPPEALVAHLHELARGLPPQHPLMRLLQALDDFDHDAALATLDAYLLASPGSHAP